jgi:hypothetical protein
LPVFEATGVPRGLKIGRRIGRKIENSAGFGDRSDTVCEDWMVNPCITSFGPLTIHPDQPLILRYRVVVHDGVTPTDLLQRLSVEWRGMKRDPFADRQGKGEQN